MRHQPRYTSRSRALMRELGRRRRNPGSDAAQGPDRETRAVWYEDARRGPLAGKHRVAAPDAVHLDIDLAEIDADRLEQ